ncbi:hypothetical protein [Actinomycetospora flava]|uniref:Uncharacterized protein n=1 Tax=Actinomycetospora flava TaxID=3129232 RepID=A0ABU8MAS7_9PSEU
MRAYRGDPAPGRHYRAQLKSAGLSGVTITPTTAVATGVSSTVVRASRP